MQGTNSASCFRRSPFVQRIPMRRTMISLAAGLAVAGMLSMAQAASPQNVLPTLSLTSPGADSSQEQSLLAQAEVPATPVTSPTAPLAVSVPGYFANWFNRVEQAQASQPHWMSPLVTVTPVLVQQVRYDQYWENQGNGGAVEVFGAGKGLELIPTTTNEILINPP